MKLTIANIISLISLSISLMLAQSCERRIIRKEVEDFEGATWGWWKLSESDSILTSAQQYLYRNYKGYVVTGPGSTTEIDSVIVYQGKQAVLSTRVSKQLLKDERRQKIVYQLENGKFYYIRLIPVDGDESGAGNDHLSVSDFVDSNNDLEGATMHQYVRTDFGKRPW